MSRNDVWARTDRTALRLHVAFPGVLLAILSACAAASRPGGVPDCEGEQCTIDPVCPDCPDAAGGADANAPDARPACTEFDWQTDIVDDESEPGWAMRSAADASGLHLSYIGHDGPNRLRYAHLPWGGSWDVQTVSDTGSWNAIAVEASGEPRLLYQETTPLDLMLATPGGGGSWASSTLTGAQSTSGGTLSMLIDSSGEIHLLYWWQPEGIKWQHGAPEGEWVTELIAEVDAPAAGSAMLTAPDGLHLVYYDMGEEQPVYGHRPPGGSWSLSPIADAGTGGFWITLARDGGGGLHVAFRNRQTNAILYGFRPAGSADWQVTDTEIAAGTGRGMAIAVDSAGTPHIAYHDINVGVILASRGGDGLFATELVGATPAEYSGYVQIAVEPNDSVHVVYRNGADGTGQVVHAVKCAPATLD